MARPPCSHLADTRFVPAVGHRPAPRLPTRYYLAAEEVRTDLLQPTETKTLCAYKGEASYWSGAGQTDVAWTYRQPLRDATEITGRIAFFNERVDVVVDGKPLPRPITPWSAPAR